MSPYIVATKRLLPSAESHEMTEFSVSRVAVATLAILYVRSVGNRGDARDGFEVTASPSVGEPRAVVAGPFDATTARIVKRELRGLPESGGTAGPLPDGTTIGVEQTTWEELANDERSEAWPESLATTETKMHAAILAAFNAQEAK